jgi:hypothetical protein
LASRFNYTAVENADGVWLENGLNEPAFEHCRVTAATVPSARSILERYVDEYSASPEYVVHYSTCLKLLSGLAKDVSLDQIEFFKRGIMFCPRIKLTELFEEGIAPIFFGVFSDGEIIIVRTRLGYWERNGFKRALYTAALYPDQIANGEISRFASLQNWNRLEPDNFLSVILRIAQYLFFPYVSGFMASHGIGLRIVFIPSRPFEHARLAFPSDWMDFLRADTELAEEHTVHFQSSKSSSLNSELLVGEDDFCGQIIRALRNTQHGYLTRGDKYSNRPARFLSMIDGNTPDNLPTLALTWVLALLASPNKFIGNPS